MRNFSAVRRTKTTAPENNKAPNNKQQTKETTKEKTLVTAGAQHHGPHATRQKLSAPARRPRESVAGADRTPLEYLFLASAAAHRLEQVADVRDFAVEDLLESEVFLLNLRLAEAEGPA
eukprot:scaffold96219_cov54-Phaeocystis_antarctica.AAC.1